MARVTLPHTFAYVDAAGRVTTYAPGEQEVPDELVAIARRDGALPAALEFDPLLRAVREGWTVNPLPEAFPARALLIGAGFESIEQVEGARDEDLQAISGIGPKTLAEIRGYGR